MRRITKKVRELYGILKLNPTECLVFEELNKHAKGGSEDQIGLRVSELATVLELPRMTCHDALSSLLERGLIEIQKIDKKTYYFVADVDAVIGKVRNMFAYKQISSDQKYSVSHVPETSRTIKNEITIYTGLKNCRAVWKRIADLNKGDKFIGVQPNASIKATMDKLGINALYPNNDALNSKGIIVEGLIHPNFYEVFYNLLKKEMGHDAALGEIEKFAGRTASVTHIDTKYLTSPTEMLFMHNTAYILNWKDEVVVEIRNKVMRDFLLELYDLAKGYGKKINLAEHTKEVVWKMRGER